MIRLIAMDLDGTLLAGHPAMLPEGNAAALREAVDAGIHLVFCSGRLPDDAGFFALDTGLPIGVIALNGGCALDAPLGEMIWSSPYAPEEAARLRACFAEAGILYAMFGGHTLWVSNPEKQYDRMWGTYLTRPGGRTRVLTGEAAADDLIAAGVHKFVALGEGDAARIAPLKEKVLTDFPHLNAAASWVDSFEVNPAGVNKGTALRRYAHHLGIDMADVMALGDEGNDVPMLQAAGTGVAMGNASTDAIRAANWQTKRNTDCGVAAAIRHLALGIPTEGVHPL